MKKRIQFLACLLAAVFLLGSTGAFADSQAPGTLQGISAERLANQEVSNLAYSKILEHYGQEANMLPEEAESGNPSILRTTPDYGDIYYEEVNPQEKPLFCSDIYSIDCLWSR